MASVAFALTAAAVIATTAITFTTGTSHSNDYIDPHPRQLTLAELRCFGGMRAWQAQSILARRGLVIEWRLASYFPRGEPTDREGDTTMPGYVPRDSVVEAAAREGANTFTSSYTRQTTPTRRTPQLLRTAAPVCRHAIDSPRISPPRRRCKDEAPRIS
jgi:hypothetical protein